MPLRQRPMDTPLDLVFGNACIPGGGKRWITFRRALLLPLL